MKKYIYTSIIGLTVLFSSCQKYLDTKPYSFNTVESLYTSPSDAEIALTGCYSALNASSIQGDGFGNSFLISIPFMFSGGNDELITENGVTDLNYAPFGLASQTSQNPALQANWFFMFASINRCNFLINNINSANVPEPRKTQIIGESRFLRGMLYYYLAMSYGGVPLYSTAIQDPKTPRSNLQDVYNFITADLTFAYQNLPNRATITGRANKWSAAGFLAKVDTYLASCKTNAVGSDVGSTLNSFDWVNAATMYASAKTITTDIINNSGYKLTANYADLFYETTKTQIAEESLFSILGPPTNSANGNDNLILFFETPVGPNAGGGYGWLRPIGELWYKYDPSDTRRAHNLTGSVETTGATESIGGFDYFIPDTIGSPLNPAACCAKWRMRESSEKSLANGSAWSDVDLEILRFADILLLDAEARFYTGDEAGARNDLRLVRARSNPSNIDALTAAYFKANFIDELLDERSRELCFESWRRIDLIRFGAYASTINGLSSTLGAFNYNVPTLKANIKPYKIWYPIPENNIQLSPALTQNTGY